MKGLELARVARHAGSCRRYVAEPTRRTENTAPTARIRLEGPRRAVLTVQDERVGLELTRKTVLTNSGNSKGLKLTLIAKKAPCHARTRRVLGPLAFLANSLPQEVLEVTRGAVTAYTGHGEVLELSSPARRARRTPGTILVLPCLTPVTGGGAAASREEARATEIARRRPDRVQESPWHAAEAQSRTVTTRELAYRASRAHRLTLLLQELAGVTLPTHAHSSNGGKGTHAASSAQGLATEQ